MNKRFSNIENAIDDANANVSNKDTSCKNDVLHEDNHSDSVNHDHNRERFNPPKSAETNMDHIPIS